MSERLFGVETEYAIAGFAKAEDVPREELVRRVLSVAGERFPGLPDLNGSGLYLGNGSRFYIDCGLHPELATPECTNPWDVVRYIRAGDCILEQVTRQISTRNSEVLCFRCNVDYSGSQTTWGCHESYLHRTSPKALPPQIIPHLVSRAIYTGAGGFNPLSTGLEFTLSPRVAHLSTVISADSTGNHRAIYHTKNEPLCGHKYHRLHVLCGESLCSSSATWLKVAATALVVAMIDAGLKPGRGIGLAEPLESLQAVAGDTSCKVVLRLAGGATCTALDIQHHYLKLAETHVRDSFMPPWAEAACRRWREMLEMLEGAPATAATTLDWAIKLAVFQDRVRRRGLDWATLPTCNRVLARLDTALEETDYRGQNVSVDLILSQASPVKSEVDNLGRYLRRRSLDWDSFRQFVELRGELREIDTRFGQVGEGGIFRTLDNQGFLTHGVPGVDNIEHAVANPPASGRARLRGEVVRQLAGGKGRIQADWQGVWDFKKKRSLDLSDPFSDQEQWRDISEENTARELGLRTRLLDLARNTRR